MTQKQFNSEKKEKEERKRWKKKDKKIKKIKSPLLSRNLALVTFGELLIVFSSKVNLLGLL